MYKSNPSRLMEQLEQDAQFYIKDDAGQFINVHVDSLCLTKKKSDAHVSLDTGEIRIISSDELYSL